MALRIAVHPQPGDAQRRLRRLNRGHDPVGHPPTGSLLSGIRITALSLHPYPDRLPSGGRYRDASPGTAV